MTHPEHDGKIWVERNAVTGEGEYITLGNVIADEKKYCKYCKKMVTVAYEPYQCIRCGRQI